MQVVFFPNEVFLPKLDISTIFFTWKCQSQIACFTNNKLTEIILNVEIKKKIHGEKTYSLSGF